MRELAEIKIFGLNEHWIAEDTKETALDLMQILYHNVLQVDNRWHFFWEGTYTVIRCNPLLVPHLKELVEANDKDLKVVIVANGYNENIETTRKYLEAFIHIFHGYSVLAMEMDSEDFVSILERINHCFLNVVTREEIVDQFRIPGDSDISEMKVHKGMGWEGLAISLVANLRMWTAGWYSGQARKYYGDKKD